MSELGRVSFSTFQAMTSLQGPEGADGSQGATGPTGPQGEAGAAGAGGGGGSAAGYSGFEEFLHVPSLSASGWFGGALNLRLTLNGANTSLDFQNCTSNRLGVALLGTGTTSSGYATLSSQAGSIPLQSGAIEWETYINIPTSGSGTQRFTYRGGIAVPNSGSDPTMGIWFSYADNVNTGKYLAHLTLPSGDVTYDMGSGPLGTSTHWEKLGFEITTSGGVDNFGQLLLKYNGVAQHTLDIGDNGDIPEVDWYDDTFRGGIYSQISKSVGSTDRYVAIDYISFSAEFLTSR